MCLLIVLAGLDAEFPILVAGNRDERRDRPSAPPGLFVGDDARMLSPRDREAGGTWLAVSARGEFAGITNLAGAPRPERARSRGHLPHLALDAGGLDAAIGAIEREVERREYAGFQLVLCDGRRAVAAVWDGTRLERVETGDGIVVVTNEHRPGQLALPGLAAARRPGLTIADRLAALAAILLDTGDVSGHRVLKTGGEYGTVSSSLIAVHRSDPSALVWRYAAGSPDRVRYRDYGNLGRRLIPAR